MDAKTQKELQDKGQHGTTATVRVKADNEQGFMVINEDDFDKEKHEKFVEARADKKSK